jgi:WD40 repeat protein
LTHSDHVYALAFSPDGKLLASGGPPDEVALWDPITGKKVRALTGPTKRIKRIAFSPDGKTLAGGGHDRIVYLWDVATGKEIRKLEGLTNVIWGLEFSSDGKALLSSEILGEIRIWDVASGKPRLQARPWQRINLFHLAWMRDGKAFACATIEAPILFFDATTGKEIGKLEGHAKFVHYLSFSKDGKTLASSSLDGTVRIWELSGDPANPPMGGKELRKIEIPGDPDELAFTADGKRLWIGHRDGACSLWDVSTGQSLSKFEAHSGMTTALAISPDGRILATGSTDKTLAIWDVGALQKKK